MKKKIKDIMFDFTNFFIIFYVLIKHKLLKKRVVLSKMENNKKIHLLANGPSLNEKLDLIDENEDIIGMVNDSITTKLFFEKEPEYLFWADPEYFKESKSEHIKNVIDIIENEVNWKLNLIIPNLYVKKLILKNEYIKIIPINVLNRNFKNDKLNNYFYKKNYISAGAQNVMVMATQYCIQKKFQIIYLHGVNNDWHRNLSINFDNELILEDTHYYGVEMRNYTKEGFLKKGEFYMMLEFISRVFKQYTYLEKYSKSIGVKIINCCDSSMIDAFDRLKK